MFGWLKRKAAFLRLSQSLIAELDAPRTLAQTQQLRAGLHAVQRLVVQRFGNAEGFLLAERDAQRALLLDLEIMLSKSFDLETSSDRRLGLTAMYHFLDGCVRHQSTAANHLGGAIGRRGLVPGYLTAG